MSTSRNFRVLPTSIGLMLYQLVLALFVANGRLARLVFWDATWYRDIAAKGYFTELPIVHHAEGGPNLGFFPAFPLWARALLNTLPITPDQSVLLAGWTASIPLWAYLILLLRRLGLRPGWVWIGTLFFLVLPGTFYGMVGYSEPLFTAALLGYIYWSTRAVEEKQNRGLLVMLAILHGSVMTGTRILGVPVVAYPVMLEIARSLPRPDLKRLLTPLLIAVTSLSGFASYLIYCAIRWGQWNIYWDANRIGWGTYFNPWKLFSASFYTDVFFIGTLSEVLGRLLTVATLVITIALTRWSWKERARNPLPLALATLNLGFLVETIVGSHGMHAMIRYLIPIHSLMIPLVMCWAQDRYQRQPQDAGPSLQLKVASALFAAWLFTIQLVFLFRYTRNEWVS